MVTTRAIANIFDQFDRSLLSPYTVGFDRMFDRLHDHYVLHQTNSGFPPYNIRQDDDYNFIIELALAGLSKDDLEFFKDLLLKRREEITAEARALEDASRNREIQGLSLIHI